tara:strand:+ start:190 stop:312 length:123 start_codon:yes stop_codon:yes gene_type:complete
MLDIYFELVWALDAIITIILKLGIIVCLKSLITMKGNKNG